MVDSRGLVYRQKCWRLAKGLVFIPENSSDNCPENSPKSSLQRPLGFLGRFQLRRALWLINRSIQCDQTDHFAFWIKGKIHQRFEELSLALESFARAYELRPNNVDVLMALVITYLELGMGASSVKFCEYLVSQQDDEYVRELMCISYLIAGDLHSAKTFARKSDLKKICGDLSAGIREFPTDLFDVHFESG